MSAIKLPKGHVILEKGETIMAGDLFWSDLNNKWTAVSISVGQPYSSCWHKTCRAVGLPTTKRTTRPQTRVSRIATAIQAGRDKDAFTVAREVERIYDNSQRAKRRKEGGK